MLQIEAENHESLNLECSIGNLSTEDYSVQKEDKPEN